MRRPIAVLTLVTLACIPDFELDQRIFTSNTAVSPEDAGDVGDAGADLDASPCVAAEDCSNGVDDNCDQATDCNDSACSGSCEDQNECTVDVCLASGACDHPNNDQGQGSGWRCRDKHRTETACADLADNDGDGLKDCRDPDCAACANPLVCCESGACSPTCL